MYEVCVFRYSLLMCNFNIQGLSPHSPHKKSPKDLQGFYTRGPHLNLGGLSTQNSHKKSPKDLQGFNAEDRQGFDAVG